jgi:hypothetical protein
MKLFPHPKSPQFKAAARRHSFKQNLIRQGTLDEIHNAVYKGVVNLYNEKSRSPTKQLTEDSYRILPQETTKPQTSQGLRATNWHQ